VLELEAENEAHILEIVLHTYELGSALLVEPHTTIPVEEVLKAVSEVVHYYPE